MSEQENDRIREEFLDFVENMPNEEFWAWVSTWFSEDVIMGMIKDWDVETMWEELKKLKHAKSKARKKVKV